MGSLVFLRYSLYDLCALRGLIDMPDIPVEQAIYSNAGGGGYRFLARSPGFLDDWLPAAEQLCTGFGDRPANVACPHALFAQPLGPDQVAIVQVADQGADDAGRPGALGFHLLVLPRKVYAPLGGDPFRLAERFPPPWEARGDLPSLSLPAETPPPRTVAQIQSILKGADTATLLGGAQALVDGGRLVLPRPEPATALLRDLWALLPDSTRCHLWPASFAFGNRLGFDVVVLPRIEPGDCEGYLTEEQAGDYPQGRYELAVQVAAESGDQSGLDTQFTRRSSADTLRLALVLVVVFAVVALVVNVVTQMDSGHRPAPLHPSARETAPLLEKYPSWNSDARDKIGHSLRKLSKAPNVEWPSGNPKIEEMLAALDHGFGTPDPKRDPGRLRDAAPGDVEKQLRLFMWKHHIAGYDNPGLNGPELAERLVQGLTPQQP